MTTEQDFKAKLTAFTFIKYSGKPLHAPYLNVGKNQ